VVTSAFGFRVQHQQASGSPDDPWHEPEGWRVSLPHQCDAWEIAPRDDYGVAPHPDAVAGLEAFIAEAHEALAALRAEKEYGK
jgi:hypothetical protein